MPVDPPLTTDQCMGARYSQVYSCFGNYRLVGVSVWTCGSDGTWSSSTTPVCQEYVQSSVFGLLSVPAPLTNGMISYSDPTLGEGAVATHSCNRNYVLIGDTKRTCQSDNKWTLSAPYCSGI